MTIREDRSYYTNTDKLLLENGMGAEGVYHVRFNGSEEDCLGARDYFDKNYKVFQLNTMERQGYDLFYCSNQGITGKLRYFTISITGYDELEMADSVVGFANKIAKDVEKLFPDLSIAIQYRVLKEEEKISEYVKERFKGNENKFFSYGYGMTGKIKKVGNCGEYGFFKKGARSRYYPLKKSEVFALYATQC